MPFHTLLSRTMNNTSPLWKNHRYQNWFGRILSIKTYFPSVWYCHINILAEEDSLTYNLSKKIPLPFVLPLGLEQNHPKNIKTLLKYPLRRRWSVSCSASASYFCLLKNDQIIFSALTLWPGLQCDLDYKKHFFNFIFRPLNFCK